MLAAVGCSQPVPTAQTCVEPGVPAASTTPGLTYYQDVQPILNTKCGGCHDGNGPGPMSLVTWDDISVFHHDVYNAVLIRHMPPWPPVTCCAEYENSFALTDDETSTILGWHEQGLLLGTPQDAGVPARINLPRIDATTAMETPYLPDPTGGALDDTRCFLLDYSPTQAVYVTGVDIKPGAPLEMHDGVVLTASAADATVLQTMDDAAPGEGWPCAGGLFGHFKSSLGGSFFQAESYAAGFGVEVLPTDRLVLRMHYTPPALGSFEEDLTSVEVMTQTTSPQPLEYLSVFDPTWVTGGFTIPPDVSDVVYRYAEDPTSSSGGKPYDVRRVNVHMNARGSKASLSVVKADGTRQCLLQIDAWDSTHQADYTLKTPVRVQAGDRVLIECHWDNTAGHQPLVNGMLATPGVLGWGEDQEMCVAFLTASLVATQD